MPSRLMDTQEPVNPAAAAHMIESEAPRGSLPMFIVAGAEKACAGEQA